MRTELVVGCRADMLGIDRLIARRLRKARNELEAYFSSLGTLDPTLSANLTRQHAELVAVRCASDSFANARVRFRARFGIYAEALNASEKRFVETAVSNARGLRVYPRIPRKLALPRFELGDERSIIPRREVSLSEMDDWIGDLGTLLQQALESTVRTACRSIVNRGAISLVRTSMAVRLAFQAALDHPSALPASATPKIRSKRSLP